jgi:hypothetical protein
VELLAPHGKLEGYVTSMKYLQTVVKIVALPIIPAKTKTILEVMEAIGIPNYDHSPNYLCNELGGSVAVSTYPQILEKVGCCFRRCADETKCNSQFLTMVM